MATAGGPNIERDGLVFGYDTGANPSSDFNHKNKKRRFFKGEPSTNLWDSIDNTQSLRGNRTQHYWDGKRWTIDGSYTDPGVPGPKNIYLGKVFKFTSGALNSVWSGNSHGYMLRDIATTSGQTYTMSAWVYASIDCDVDSIPAVIEGEAGGESTVSGFPASYNLSNKGTWQRTAKKALADGNVRFIPTYTKKIGVTDGSFSGFFMWAAPQVVLGDRPRPYIQTGTSRSSTQSLIDLTRTSTIDVSNVSFDSTGQPTFDGTDDVIQLPTNLIDNLNTSELTVEAIVYHTSWGTNGSSRPYISNWNSWQPSPANQRGFILRTFGTEQFPRFYYCWGASYNNVSASGTTFNLNQFHHVVGVFKKDSYAKIYVDGVEAGSTTTGTGNNLVYDDSTGTYIGYGTINTGRYVGDLPVAKIYNRALSAQEIKQNYNTYKNRFNI